MKSTLFLTILFISGLGFSQQNKPLYQQIVFDFYRTEIIDSISEKKKINIYKFSLNFKTNLNSYLIPYSSCVTIKDWGNKKPNEIRKEHTESLISINPNRFKFHFFDLDRKQFKIKTLGKGGYPKLLIGSPYMENENEERILMNIYI